MTRDEHLYTIAAEEAVEVAQRCTKALRFGGDEVQPGQPLDNRVRILQEFSHLLAALEMLGFSVGPSPLDPLRQWVDAKKEQVERFIRYSEECGTLVVAGRTEQEQAK